VIRPPTAAALVRLRESRGLTQRAWAPLCGYSSKTIAAWEVGATSPTLLAVIDLCDAAGVSLATFGEWVEEGRRG
jgi:DNA-binding transcriptional regulator YiaG